VQPSDPNYARGDAAREMLAQLGYRVLERVHEWHECLILEFVDSGGGDPPSRVERAAGFGRGTTAEHALQQALDDLLPSRLAKELFEAALAQERPNTAEPGPDLRPWTSETRAAPELSAPPRIPPGPGHAAPPVFAVPPPPAEVLEALEGLAKDVDDAAGEALLDAPDPLRWQMAALLARARGWAAAIDHPAIHSRVKHIATQLARWSRRAWPGYFPLLELDCTPAQAGRWLGAPNAATWDDIAAAADALLESAAAADGGWSDEVACDPPPTNPGWSLGHAVNLVKKRLGPGAEPDTDAARSAADRWREHEAAMDGFVRAARELRWVRPVTPDPAAWADTMGLLRWLAHHWKLPAGHALVVALDPAHHPRPDWAHAMGRDERTLERARRQRDVLRMRPSRATSDSGVVAWFAKASEVFDAVELAPLCFDVNDRILALDPTLVFTSGPARDRLKKVQKRLSEGGGKGALAPAMVALAAVEEVEDIPPAEREPTPVERARDAVAGQRALVVGNREDPHLARRYRSDLGLVVDWCDSSQGARAVEAAMERILQGQYDLALCHTGFVGHATDGKVKKACRGGNVRYVPVYKGRVLATSLALLANLGRAGV